MRIWRVRKIISNLYREEKVLCISIYVGKVPIWHLQIIIWLCACNCSDIWFQCCGSGMFILDPWSWIFKIFEQEQKNFNQLTNKINQHNAYRHGCIGTKCRKQKTEYRQQSLSGTRVAGSGSAWIRVFLGLDPDPHYIKNYELYSFKIESWRAVDAHCVGVVVQNGTLEGPCVQWVADSNHFALKWKIGSGSSCMWKMDSDAHKSDAGPKPYREPGV